jgi:predicted ester cyclase
MSTEAMRIKTSERAQHAAAVDSAEHNRIVASQWIDAFNARDDAAEAAARTADYIAHAPDSIQAPALDGDAWVEFLGVFIEGFPDLHLEVLDSSADEGMVAQRILFTGTHTGPFRGLPPTGRKVRFSGLEINRMVDSRVAEHWFQLDSVTLFEQLGLHVVPGPRLFARLIGSTVTRLLRTLPRSTNARGASAPP